jgi:hypothetical protein
MFHMNVTRTPTESNAGNLRKQFPHLEVTSSVPAKKPRGKAKEKANTTKPMPPKAEDGASSKPDKKPVALTLPTLSGTAASSGSPSSQQPEKKLEPSAAQSDQEKKPKRRALSPVESEEEDDDGDDVLTLEIPQGNPDAFRGSNFSGTMPVALTRRFSEFARDMERETDEDDTKMEDDVEAGYEEDHEDEEEDEEAPRQPPNQGSHTKTENPVAVEPEVYTFDDGDDDSNADAGAGAGADDALDQDFGDLEAELERELEMVQNEGHESDSSVSEED